MKLAWVFGVLALAPSNLLALVDQKPDGYAIKKIQDKLDDANAKQFGPNWQKLVEIEEQAGLRDPRTHERLKPRPAPAYFMSEAERSTYFRYLDNFVRERDAAYAKLKDSPRLEEYIDARWDHKQEQEEAGKLYAEAIKKTIELYDLPSLGTSGAIKNGPPKKKTPLHVPSHEEETAVWEPKVNPEMSQGTNGQTFSDGRVELGPGALEYVGKLAYTLWHENQHVQDYLTPRSKLDLVNEPANEVRIRKEGLKYREPIFDLDQRDLDDDDKYIASEQRRAQTWKTELLWIRIRGGDPYSAKSRADLPGAMTYGVLGDPEVTRRLAEIQNGEEDLKARLDQEAAWRRSQEKPPPPATMPQPAAPPHCPVQSNLSSLAGIVCRSPNLINSDQIDANLCDFPDGSADIVLRVNDPPSCEKDLFMELMDLNRRLVPARDIGRDWLIREAWRFKQQNAPKPTPPQDPPPSSRDDDSPPKGRGGGGSDYNHCIDPGGSCLHH